MTKINDTLRGAFAILTRIQYKQPEGLTFDTFHALQHQANITTHKYLRCVMSFRHYVELTLKI